MNSNSLLNKLYKKALLPNILLVLGGTINVFFDGILVGQKLGDAGLNAVNQCLPFYLLLCTIGSLVASGAVALSAIEAGENKLDEAKRYYSVGLFLGIAFSVLICGLAYIFIEQICGLLSNELSYEYVYEYLRLTIIFGIFKVLLYNFVFYLRLEGKLKRSSFSMLLMTVLNIALDYIFLFVADMGIYGAALASGIATFVACALCFIFLYTDNSNFNLLPKIPKKGDIKKISVQGSSMAINNIASSLKIFIFNQIFKIIDIPSLVSIFAIISNLNEFSICVQNGVPQTSTAIIGILFGGKEYKEIKKLMKTQYKCGILLSIGIGLLFSVSAKYIPSIFGSSISCVFAIICFSSSLILATINSVFTYYYSSIQKINIANIITFLRILVLPVVILFILQGVPDYIWILYPLTELLCFVITIIITSSKRKDNLSKIYLLDEKLEEEGKIYSLITEANSESISKASQGANEFCEEHELSSKKSMALSLSIEEILMIIAEKSLNFNGNIDLRVFKMNDDVILRFRSSGKYYNPFEENDDSLDYLGVRMIEKMANRIDYQSTLGINTLIIYL